MNNRLRKFLLPDFSRAYLLRLGIIAVLAAVFFGFICRPCVISGASMMPAYPERGFTFCWRPAYWFDEPSVGDPVILRFVGRNVLLLKRIVALPGDTVEFREGSLLVNGEESGEAWNQGSCTWNLPPRIVEVGHFYVVGDNRSMIIENHVFGQIPANRILGKPLW